MAVKVKKYDFITKEQRGINTPYGVLAVFKCNNTFV